MPDPSLTVPGRLIAEGCEARVFGLDGGRVFRVSCGGYGSDERAFLAHVAAWEHGAPVPRPYGPARIGGLPGLVMERLDPFHLLHSLGRAPWTVVTAGRVLGSVHAAVHGVVAPTSLPTMHDVLRSRIACRDLPRHRLERLVRNLPTGSRLLHGDFNPANLLRCPATGAWLTVDWSGAARGCPAADVALTLVTIAHGAVPAAAPRWARAAAPVAAAAVPCLPRRLPGAVSSRSGRRTAVGGGVAVAAVSGAGTEGQEGHTHAGQGGALARLARLVPEHAASGLTGPWFGGTRRAALGRWLLGPLRRRDVVIPFGACAGIPFNAGGSAPSFALGISEPHVQAALRDLLGPGDVFYDIGANVGFYTVLGARCVGPEGHVYSFEPLPENVAALRRNAGFSRWPNVSVLACALADRSGPAMLTPAGEPFWARLSTLPPPPGARAAIPVSCRSVDELVRGGQIALPHVVKIDVEGAELGVLRGMAGTLRTARPVIVCETHGTGEETRAFLSAAGYTVEPLRYGSRSRRGASRHVLAVAATPRP